MNGSVPAAPQRHPHDILAEDLERAIASASRPDLLKYLVAISREAFGFYTRHYPHTINYPWAAEKLERFAPGARVLDIGAGVSPLPLWAASRGLILDCVDGSEIVRTLPTHPDWNEWGYFDYGLLDTSITAHHCWISDFKPTHTYDAIYSMCSLAHMLSTEWKETLFLCRNWLRAGGLLLLCIDLIPRTYFLWNIASRVEFEPRVQHGTVSDVESHLVELGFDMGELRIRRNIPDSRTDLLFIDCAQPLPY